MRGLLGLEFGGLALFLSVDFIEGGAVRSHHTFLESDFANGHGANGVDGLHALFDLLFQFTVEQCTLNIEYVFLAQNAMMMSLVRVRMSCFTEVWTRCCVMINGFIRTK